MKHVMFGNKQRKMTFLSLALFCILISGCSENPQGAQTEEKPSSEDINIKTVEEVLKLELTAPDWGYVELSKEMPTPTPNPSEEEIQKAQAFSEKYTEYVKSKYEPYFTENGLNNFLVAGPVYQYHVHDKEYKLTIEDMEVVQSENENAKNQYEITVHVAYEEPNEEKETYEVNGVAFFSEDGKIGKMSIGDKEQLLMSKLRE